MSVDTARSLLFVPADNPRRLAKAWAADVDVVIADLEDAVAPAAKDSAREALRAHLESAGRPRGALWVRVNGIDTEHAERDLALAGDTPLTSAVVLPKTTYTAVGALTIAKPIVALVETAEGLLDVAAIARCSSVARLMLGTVDLAAELAIDISPDSAVLEHARCLLAVASAAARLPGPVDGVWVDIGDEPGLRREAAAARAAGFAGKACIHPDQIATVREVFSPSPHAISRAQRIVAAADAALREGQGVIEVDGRMVDRPVVEQARRIASLVAPPARIQPVATADAQDERSLS
jgi:citrate lyase subunit beta / citryl-CoA lyase